MAASIFHPVANEPARPTMCELTETAMRSLNQVAAHLQTVGEAELSALELRTLLWSRCSLAALYGIRVDESLAALDSPDLGALLCD